MNATDLEALMRKSLIGDKRAYSDLLQAVSRLLRPYLSRSINNTSEVEDVLQEILLSIHKAKHTYDGNRPLKPWIYAIAKFRLQDYLRKIYHDHLRYAEAIDEVETIFETNVTENGMSYESIRKEVAQLSPKQAQILELLHEQGHTSKEVAKKLQMTESAVKVSAHRAYKILKEKLG